MSKNLEALKLSCTNINKALLKAGSPYSIEAGARNGYLAVDLYKGALNCVRTLATGGTLRECVAAAYEEGFYQLANTWYKD